MTDPFKTSLLAAVMALLAETPTFADNTVHTPGQTDVQEKCAKDAADFLDRLKAGGGLGIQGIPSGEQQNAIKEVRSHHNVRFNKCFSSVVATWTVMGRDVGDDTKNFLIRKVTVYDVNEGEEIGSFSAHKELPLYDADTPHNSKYVPRVVDKYIRMLFGLRAIVDDDWKVNSCFVNETFEQYTKRPEDRPLPKLTQCAKGGETVEDPASWPNWDALIKPYMQGSE